MPVPATRTNPDTTGQRLTRTRTAAHPPIVDATGLIAAVLEGNLPHAAALLREHLDDGTGHCRVCVTDSQHITPWPCVHYTAAARALRLSRP